MYRTVTFIIGMRVWRIHISINDLASLYQTTPGSDLLDFNILQFHIFFCSSARILKLMTCYLDLVWYYFFLIFLSLLSASHNGKSKVFVSESLYETPSYFYIVLYNCFRLFKPNSSYNLIYMCMHTHMHMYIHMDAHMCICVWTHAYTHQVHSHSNGCNALHLMPIVKFINMLMTASGR